MGNGSGTPAVSADVFRPKHTTHRIFLGPKFLFSLYHNRDEDHDTSSAFVYYVRDGELPYRHLVVNEHAIDEAATRLKRRSTHRNAVRMLENVEESHLYRFERVADGVFEEARTRFIEWDDKDASFTDFLIATHMEATEVEYIATYDPHFDTFGLTTVPYTQ